MSNHTTGAESPDCFTAHSAARFAELVKKNVTSTAERERKRKTRARKTLYRVTKEQRRYAKANGLRAIAVTLTYADDADFNPKNICAFIDSLRRALKRRGYSLPYVWVLERAARLHYHLILWLPRRHPLDKARLERLWSWGATYLASCRAVTAYSKYISKCNQLSELPRHAKLYGYGGLDEAGKAALQRSRLPRWLKLKLPLHARARRTAGGWVNTATGELHASPYRWTPSGSKLREPKNHAEP